MTSGFLARLQRWFTKPPAQPVGGLHARGSTSEPVYERTPRPTVGVDWQAPTVPAPAGLIHVDDVGPIRLVVGTRFSIGADGDLPLGPEGAGLLAGMVLQTSLQAGARWVLVPLADAPLSVDGAPLAGPTTIGDGDRIEFDDGTSLRVLAPDPASAALLLELPEGRDDFGARRAALVPGGVQGRLVIGSGPRSHVRVETLDGELDLVHEAGRIVLRVRAGSSLGQADTSFDFPSALLQHVDVGPRRGARPPFGVALGPLDPERPAFMRVDRA
ncbi:MAG: hypothetical protein WD226_10715 [Planctomycetota bacterium]